MANHVSEDLKRSSFPLSLPILIVAFFAVVTIALISEAGTWGWAIASVAYLVIAVAIGCALLAYRRHLYLSYAIILWVFTPGIRRLIDYSFGIYDQNPAMLAPFFVSFLAGGLSIFSNHRIPKSLSTGIFLCTAGLFYGFLIGCFKAAPGAALLGLLQWLVPIWLAYFLVADFKNYPLYRTTLVTTIKLCLTVTAIYSVIQFCVVPPWDKFWMIEAGMRSVGLPEPFRVRAFSTLNSPGPYAMMTMVSLLILTTLKLPAKWLYLSLGFLGLLVSLVRISWLGLAFGYGILLFRLSGISRAKLLFGLVSLAAAITLLIVNQDAFYVVTNRLSTFRSIHDDHSIASRLETVENTYRMIIADPIGYGLGSAGTSARLLSKEQRLDLDPSDAGPLSIIFQLGWLGAALYFLGMLFFFHPLYGVFRRTTDRFALASTVVVAALLGQTFAIGNIQDLFGVMLWGFAAIGLSSSIFINHQKTRT